MLIESMAALIYVIVSVYSLDLCLERKRSTQHHLGFDSFEEKRLKHCGTRRLDNCLLWFIVKISSSSSVATHGPFLLDFEKLFSSKALIIKAIESFKSSHDKRNKGLVKKIWPQPLFRTFEFWGERWISILIEDCFG